VSIQCDTIGYIHHDKKKFEKKISWTIFGLFLELDAEKNLHRMFLPLTSVVFNVGR